MRYANDLGVATCNLGPSLSTAPARRPRARGARPAPARTLPDGVGPIADVVVVEDAQVDAHGASVGERRRLGDGIAAQAHEPQLPPPREP